MVSFANDSGLTAAMTDAANRAAGYRSSSALAVRASSRRGSGSGSLSRGSSGSADGPSGAIIGAAGYGGGGTNYRAAEQYRYLRDYVYTAIRPIATRVSGQQVHAAVVSDKQMAKAYFEAAKSFTSRDPAEHLFSFKRSLPECFKQLGDQLEPIEDHPLLKIMERPNGLMVGTSHMYTTVASLQLTGKSNWWLDPHSTSERGGLPSLWYMPVHWCEPKHGKDKLFESWEVSSPGATRKAIVPGQLMAYFSLPDPSDPLGALAPLQSQAKAVATDEQIQTSQYASAKQGIRPGVILKAGRLPDVRTGTEGPRPVLTAEQRSQLITAMQLAYEGAARHGHPAIVDGLIEDIVPFTTSPIDMDYPGGSLLTKNRIMQGFGVNPIVAGQIENANRASAAVADSIFCDNVLNPLITLLSQTMTVYLGPLFQTQRYDGKSGRVPGNQKTVMGSRLVIWIEPARPRDDDLTLRQWTVALSKDVVDDDEYRKVILNLPPKTDEQRAASLQRMQEKMKIAAMAKPAAGAPGQSTNNRPAGKRIAAGKSRSKTRPPKPSRTPKPAKLNA